MVCRYGVHPALNRMWKLWMCGDKHKKYSLITISCSCKHDHATVRVDHHLAGRHHRNSRLRVHVPVDVQRGAASQEGVVQSRRVLVTQDVVVQPGQLGIGVRDQHVDSARVQRRVNGAKVVVALQLAQALRVLGRDAVRRGHHHTGCAACAPCGALGGTSRWCGAGGREQSRGAGVQLT